MAPQYVFSHRWRYRSGTRMDSPYSVQYYCILHVRQRRWCVNFVKWSLVSRTARVVSQRCNLFCDITDWRLPMLCCDVLYKDRPILLRFKVGLRNVQTFEHVQTNSRENICNRKKATSERTTVSALNSLMLMYECAWLNSYLLTRITSNSCLWCEYSYLSRSPSSCYWTTSLNLRLSAYIWIFIRQ